MTSLRNIVVSVFALEWRDKPTRLALILSLTYGERDAIYGVCLKRLEPMDGEWHLGRVL